MSNSASRGDAIRRHEESVRKTVWTAARQFSDAERRHAELDEVLAVELQGTFPETALAVTVRYADGEESRQMFPVWEARRFHPSDDLAAYHPSDFVAGNIVDRLRGDL
jgi:hypothetical protein